MLQKIVLILAIQFSIMISCKSQNNNNSMTTDTSLQYIIRQSKDKNVSAHLLVLLHGHGSNENDLFSFSSQIPENWIVVSVRAPYKLGENSYRWYDVKMVNEKIVVNIEEEEKAK